MILYLDTSALVKAYVNETYSKEILSLLKEAKIAASHFIAYVEANAAFSKISREKKLKEKDYESVKKIFEEDWKNYLHVETNQELMRRAAEFCEAFALRAYDSVHLAAADLLLKQANEQVIFACFDNQLNKAAHVLGLSLAKIT